MASSATARWWIDLQEWSLGRAHLLASRVRPRRVGPAHLETGLRGEQAALFHLRRLGYTIVASRWTSVKMRGDVDLIGWDGDWLCFVEVKTRRARDLTPAESAVDRDKEQMLRRLAHAYLRAFAEEKRRLIPVRFDVVSVYLLKSGTEFEVFKGAFDFQVPQTQGRKAMGMKYAAETVLTELDPVDLGIRLSEMVAEAMVWLEQASGQRASVAQAEGKWCAKEVVGHMIDSAVNNLQRIVRLDTVLDIEPEVQSQNYEQDEWVRAQHYAEKEWVQVLELWRVLNEHIAWTMRHVARAHLGRLCVFPDGHVTMGFLMEDYVAHMAYHLRALKTWL